MACHRSIGLHLRLADSIVLLAHEALEYQLNCFQFFLTPQKATRYITLSKNDCELFLSLRRQHFSQLVIHSSYWINPSSGNKTTYSIAKRLLKKEQKLAHALEANYIVLHAGTATNYTNIKTKLAIIKAGIQTVAKLLNSVTKKETKLMFLIENTAFGNLSIGGNFDDLAYLKTLLLFPERVGFCLDFAHAFAYGYNLNDAEGFIALIDQKLGLENIKLIHANDSAEKQGSKKDRHAPPGEGEIGKPTLQKLITHAKLCHIPIILELPNKGKEAIQRHLHTIRQWNGDNN